MDIKPFLEPKDFSRFGVSSNQASKWIKSYYAGRCSNAVKVACELMLGHKYFTEYLPQQWIKGKI